jgi:hypothetical protein
MRESCFCGRSGELEDREPVLLDEGRWVLRCPDCKHADDLGWLDEEAALMVWGEARRRRENSTEAA